MTPEDIEKLAAALDRRVKRSTGPAPATNGSKLKDWIPIILTTLSVGAAMTTAFFMSRSEAGVEHRALEADIAVERTVNAVQEQHFIDHDGKFEDVKESFQALNENIKQLARPSQRPAMRDIPE